MGYAAPLLWLLLTTIVGGCSPPRSVAPAVTPGAAADTPHLAQLYEAARHEGEVVFESAQNTETMQPLIDRFTVRYPGISVSYANRTPGETVERVVAESAAGRITIDGSSSSIRTVLPLADRNLMMSADWNLLAPGLPAEARLLSDRFVAWYHLPNVLAYNTNLVRPEDLPREWEDLLAPRWRGRKLVLDARGIGLEMLPFVWGKERAYDFVGRLKSQDPILVPRSAVSIERVAAGEAPLGAAVFPNVFEYQARGAPIDWVRLPIYEASTFGLYATAGGPHPHAAQLWLAFLLSKEGRQIYEDTAYYSLMFPGSNTRMERALREGNVQLWVEDSEAVARQRAAGQKDLERLLGGLR
jgi:iron(III) transport system substrate-binding protein